MRLYLVTDVIDVIHLPESMSVGPLAAAPEKPPHTFAQQFLLYPNDHNDAGMWNVYTRAQSV